jgi:hypothetical protein
LETKGHPETGGLSLPDLSTQPLMFLHKICMTKEGLAVDATFLVA